MSSIDGTSYEFNPTSRRYGASISHDLLKFVIDRSPIAHYLVFGIVREAMIHGFNVIRDGEIDEDTSNEIREFPEYDSMLDIAERALGYERGYGWSVLIPFRDKHREFPVFKVFYNGDDAYSEITYDSLTPVSVKYRLMYDLVNNKDAIEGVTKDFLFIINEGVKIGQGTSYIYPIFDDLVGDLVLSQSTSLYLTRLGGGIKKMGVPMSFFDEDNKKLRANTLKNLEALGYNTNFIYPKGTDGEEYDFEIYTGTGTAMNIKEAQEFYLNRISVYTGIPKNKFLGSELGLRSSEQNYSYFSTQIQNVRRDLRRIFLYMLPLYGFEVSDISFIDSEETREREKLENLDLKIEILKKMLFLKTPKEQALALLDLEIDIDDTVFEQFNAQNDNSDDTQDDNSDNAQEDDKNNFDN